MNMTQYNPYQFNNQRLSTYPQQTNGIIWVQGIEGAKAYQLAPNSNAILMDSESNTFYIKTCDNIGMGNLRTFNYSELAELDHRSTLNNESIKYITKQEVTEMLEELKGELLNGNQSISTTKSSKSTT